jgi:hypothetical protein
MSVPTQVPNELSNELPAPLPTSVPAAAPAPRSKRMSIGVRDRILSIASPLGLLIVWELAV